MVVAKINNDFAYNIRLALAQTTTVEQALSAFLNALGENCWAKYLALIPLKTTEKHSSPLIWSIEDVSAKHDATFVELAKQFRKRGRLKNKAIFILDLKKDNNLKSFKEDIKELSLKSVETIFFSYKKTEEHALCLYYSAETKALDYLGDKKLEEACSILNKHLADLLTQEEAKKGTLTKEEDFYKRLVENSEAVIFSVNIANELQYISKRAIDFFGIAPDSYPQHAPISWLDLIHPEDFTIVEKKVRQMQEEKVGFEIEFRAINQLTSTERFLLTKLVPVFNDQKELIAWDGFAIDISAKKQAQESLEAQSKKVRALYAVSSAIRGYLEPENIAARGLAAIADATVASAAMCFLYPSMKAAKLNLVAHRGFASGIAEELSEVLIRSILFELVTQKNQSIVIDNCRTDPRTKDIFEDEEFASAMFVPLIAEDEIFGVVAVFHNQEKRFDTSDLMLVTAAASQIALAARQAILFSSYRRHTKNLTALYRISHELSYISPLEDIFTQAFTIIRDELGLKRLWLGLVDTHGKRIIGQAAYGPGWKKKLVEIDVAINDSKNPIHQVIEGRKVIVVNEPEKLLGPILLRRFFSQFALKSLVLAPLVSRGQVLGVLAVQPSSQEVNFDDDDLSLLYNLANEIATLILTKRLESRINEGEKMRSIGLLAAGIAHNFNNLLQAVLGQASLLEMGKTSDAQVEKAARIISEAALKGAGLVKQLLSFANIDSPQSQACQVNEVISSEIKNWNFLLSANQQIKLSLKSELPKVKIDPRQFVRIMNILVSNAAEAMKDKGGLIQIFSDTTPSEQELMHFEVPLGNYIRVGVRDRGVGMDEETRRRCFEPFFTTKNIDPKSGLSFTGAGLGLATAYALARKNGGRLVVDSKLGQGSVFTIYLPMDEVDSPEISKEIKDKKEDVNIEL